MLAVLLTLLVCLVLGGLVLAYVAYPHRGEEVPGLPWVGEWMRRGVDQLPRVEEGEQPLIRKR